MADLTAFLICSAGACASRDSDSFFINAYVHIVLQLFLRQA